METVSSHAMMHDDLFILDRASKIVRICNFPIDRSHQPLLIITFGFTFFIPAKRTGPPWFPPNHASIRTHTKKVDDIGQEDCHKIGKSQPERRCVASIPVKPIVVFEHQEWTKERGKGNIVQNGIGRQEMMGDTYVNTLNFDMPVVMVGTHWTQAAFSVWDQKGIFVRCCGTTNPCKSRLFPPTTIVHRSRKLHLFPVR